MARGWGGGRVNCGRVHAIFNQEITPLEPRPNLNFLTYYTATKNSFTLLEITIGQEKIHGLSVQHLSLHLPYFPIGEEITLLSGNLFITQVKDLAFFRMYNMLIHADIKKLMSTDDLCVFLCISLWDISKLSVHSCNRGHHNF
jgi:hypothetical protein